MSLKVVHIFFIVASVSLSLFFGFWSFNHYSERGGLILTAMLVLAAVLVVYLIRFIGKTKQL